MSVLRHIADMASKAQLCKVLELHEVEFYPHEKLKKLRSRLEKYINTLVCGKCLQAEAEKNKLERLRKLDDIRRSWPKMLPPSFKEKIVRNFRAATSSTALATFTCACCARLLPLQERVCKSHEDVNLHLLESPSMHWNDPCFPPPPTAFVDGRLKDKLLDSHGVTIQGESITLDLCASCSRCLRRKTIPKHCQGHSSLDAPSELNPPQRIPSPLLHY